LGYFKVKALAQIAEAEAYFLTRLSHQTALYAATAGRLRRVELTQLLHGESYALVERPLYLGVRERVAVRLIAARVPAAVVNEALSTCSCWYIHWSKVELCCPPSSLRRPELEL